MAGERLRVWALLSILTLAAAPAGVAGAQSSAQTQYEAEDAALGGVSQVPVLEDRVRDQEAALRDRISEISAVGAGLEEAQSRAEGSHARAEDLRQQTRQLERQISFQEDALRKSEAGYREKARVAYTGDGLEGLTALLDGWFGSGKGDPEVARVLLDGRQSLAEYEDSVQTLRNTKHQISQKRHEYESALEEEQTRAGEFRRHKQELDKSIARLGVNKARTEGRLQRLKAAEKARILRRMAASGGGTESRDYELDVAREDIVARSVEPITRREYIRLYKRSARDYGFGPDWYVLAAVGKVESNHGENMGPSSSGAMGPMQFLPSTWETSGVDGNGDGVANIMDPEDAIPAAASYLKDGGAPQDWYKALYTYNHADWYVMKVLAVAEAYRRLENDNGVGPYL